MTAPPPPAPSFTPVTNTDLDLDDDLPRPGKVWDNTGPSLAEMLKQQSPSTTPPEVTAGASHPDSNLAPVSSHDVQGIWRNLLGAVRDHAGIAAMLTQGRFVGFDDDGSAVISTTNSFTKASLDRNGKKDLIRDTLSQILNRPVGLKIIVDETPQGPGPTASAAPRPAPVVPANPAHRVATPEPAAAAPPAVQDTSVRLTPELRDQLRTDPLIKTVLETLGGDIIKVDQA